MNKYIKKTVSRLLILSLVAGSVLSGFSYGHVRAQSATRKSAHVLSGDDQTATPTPIPTLSPSEVALRERIEAAEKKTKQAPIFGCRGSIGEKSTDNGKLTIFADIVQDLTANIRHETEAQIDKDGSRVSQKEAWYDTAKNKYYTYDDKKGQYIYEPGGEDHSILAYFSLDFYLEYVSKTPVFLQDDPVELDSADGRKVKCDVIRHEHEARDYMITGSTDSTRLVYLVYYIGQEDGLIYRIEHGKENSEATLDLYYPTENLSIPAEYTQNPVLADEVMLRKNNFCYVTYSKGGKTYLSAYFYIKKNVKKIRLIPSIKLGKRTYKVNRVDERAFFGMSKLKKVTLPKTITSIGKEAFGGCTSLNTLVVKNKALKKKLKKSKKYIKRIMFEGNKIL